MPLFNFFANIIFQLLASIFGNKIPFHVKFTLMNILLTCSFISLPLITKFAYFKGAWLLYVFVFINGSFNAILQASVFGLGGVLPFRFTIAIMAGNGVVGLGIGCIRMICLAAFSGVKDVVKGEWYGTIVYFSITTVLVLCGLFGLVAISRDPILMAKINVKRESNFTASSYFAIWKAIMIEAIIVFMTFVITFLVFPAVAMSQTLPFTNKFKPNVQSDWNAALLSTIFNLFDTVGRFLPIFATFFPKNKLYLLLSLRYIFVIFFACVSLFGKWASSWFMILNMSLFSFTNGFSSSLAMGFGPSNVPDDSKGVAGNMMSFHLIFGIFVGTLGGKGVNNLLNYFIKRK